MFLSSATNKVDGKGRVSLPARFRAALGEHRDQGIVAFPSYADPAIEACGQDFMQELSERVGRLDQFSEQQRLLNNTLFALSVELNFDSTGRILLPDRLLEHAGISDTAVFVGLGKTFQIWAPERYETHWRAMLQQAKESKLTLTMRPVPESGGRT
jgi:MraZ protein